jgi:hypothetical protein
LPVLRIGKVPRTAEWGLTQWRYKQSLMPVLVAGLTVSGRCQAQDYDAEKQPKREAGYSAVGHVNTPVRLSAGTGVVSFMIFNL